MPHLRGRPGSLPPCPAVQPATSLRQKSLTLALPTHVGNSNLQRPVDASRALRSSTRKRSAHLVRQSLPVTPHASPDLLLLQGKSAWLFLALRQPASVCYLGPGGSPGFWCVSVLKIPSTGICGTSSAAPVSSSLLISSRLSGKCTEVPLLEPGNRALEHTASAEGFLRTFLSTPTQDIMTQKVHLCGHLQR